MSTENISVIQKELEGFSEVKLPYPFKPGDTIKYITLYDETEKFYFGGNFVKMGQERIVLSHGGKQWSFQTKIRDDQNDVIYISRIFLKQSKQSMEGGSQKNLQKTVEAQQLVIEKMTHMIHKLQTANEKYKQAFETMKKIR